VANTTLIKTRPRAQLSAIAFRTFAEDAYQPAFPQVSRLQDRDIELVHEELQKYTKTGNVLLTSQMANKLKSLLQVEVPTGIDHVQFLYTVAKDYNFITAREV